MTEPHEPPRDRPPPERLARFAWDDWGTCLNIWSAFEVWCAARLYWRDACGWPLGPIDFLREQDNARQLIDGRRPQHVIPPYLTDRTAAEPREGNT